MLNWLESKKLHLRKPIVQAAKVTKIGLLLGSSTAQHCIHAQRQLEEAVKAETGKYIKMEVLTKVEKFRDEQKRFEKTPILSIQVKQEQSEEAKESLQKVLKSGKPSPIGR